jgi:hypothetical protein
LYCTIICKLILCVLSFNINVNLILEPFNTTLFTFTKASCGNKLCFYLPLNLLFLDFKLSTNLVVTKKFDRSTTPRAAASKAALVQTSGIVRSRLGVSKFPAVCFLDSNIF